MGMLIPDDFSRPFPLSKAKSFGLWFKLIQIIRWEHHGNKSSFLLGEIRSKEKRT
jgi:hypothetical protein